MSVGLSEHEVGVRRRTRRGLGAALVVDNVGSGMYLPLTVVFVVRSVGLSVGLAGSVLTLGTLAGLLAPAAVGRVSDRVEARVVVIASMLIQAAGLVCYLFADGAGLTVVAAALVAAGTQTFYSALFTLISEVVAAGPKDHAFASVAMARAAAFGAGSLLAALLLTVASTDALRVAVAVDAVSFLLAATLLGLLVQPAASARSGLGEQRPVSAADGAAGSVARDRPFLVLVGSVALLALVTDFFLVGLPAYALTVLHTAGWVPGVCLAMLTASTASLGGLVVRKLARTRRTTALAVGAGCYLIWSALTAIAAALPPAWVAPRLIGSTLVLIAGSLIAGTRANAIAEAAAPPHLRGRYLATFQYAFTIAGLLAPLVVGLFTVSTWLPWVIVAGSALVGAAALPWLARTMPPRALYAHPPSPGV